VAVCAVCHSDADPANYTPVGEEVFPPYYGTPDTNADEPCNPTAQANINENWTIDTLFEGVDNDGDGVYDTADPDCVVNQPPTSDPNGPYNATVGEQVQFDGSGSNDPEGSIVAYDWDFGDGNTGAGVSPAHAYAAAGTYPVSLTVTDNDGLTDTATTTATIQVQVEAYVSLEKLQAPKILKLGTKTVSKKITAVDEADSKAQDATVTLSWELMPTGLVNLIVFPAPPSITQTVMPGKGSDRFKFNADISCNQSGASGTIKWTATIDAPENRDSSNDEVTATTNVTCR
jgi:PKD repeat protein